MFEVAGHEAATSAFLRCCCRRCLFGDYDVARAGKHGAAFASDPARDRAGGGRKRPYRSRSLKRLAAPPDNQVQQIELLGKLLLFDKQLSANRNRASPFCPMPKT